ncbi:MAG TPA: DUF1552 domain-containing protein [Gemmataceae bacterium]|nr:DUF1552 domain-containing protein [Gemmataceae bacterium]
MLVINRREALRCAALGAGGLVLLPLIQQLEAQAAGTADRARRFVFVIEGNGLPWQQITPIEITTRKRNLDALTKEPISKLTLPKALEPLNPWKDRVTVINGLSGRVCGGGHSNDFGALGVYPARGGVGSSGMPQGETIDFALGNKLGGIFPQVSLGMISNWESGIVYNCSALGKNKPLPTIVKPELAYGTLFGSVAGGEAKQLFLARNNMLDFLLDDMKRLEKTIGSAEREKLDQHLEAYEILRNRQSRLNEIESTLRQQAPVVNNKYKSEVETDHLDAMFDIGTAALIGGLTNCLTIASGVGNPYFSVTFKGLGIQVSKHTIGHGGSYNGMTWEVMAVIIRRFHFELIARMMKKLESVKEGNGTMLDNTLIVYLSDAAEAHHSRCWEWPFVLIGNLGGVLKTGQYIEYPSWGKKGHREIGNLYTTFLHAVGDRRDYFGMHEPTLKGVSDNGPLPELLA